MKQRVIVSFVSQQTVPIYLFIKEMYKEGDGIWLIASQGDMEKPLKHLGKVLSKQFPKVEVKKIVFDQLGIEDDWALLNQQLEGYFDGEHQYVVSINGGTKPMNIALYSILNQKEAAFYYIPFPKQEIRNIGGGELLQKEITASVDVNTYANLYGHKLFGGALPIRSAERNQQFMDAFVKELQNYEVIKFLRKMRDNEEKKKLTGREKKLSEELENNDQLPTGEIDGWGDLMEETGFEPSDDDFITKEEVDYLTGGWFEEWTYQQIKIHLGLQKNQILLGSRIDNPKFGNELDVAFMYKNKLYIVECKSAITGQKSLNNYLQKLNSVKANFRSLSATGAIYGIGFNSPGWKKAAEALGLTYMSKDDILDENKRFSFI